MPRYCDWNPMIARNNEEGTLGWGGVAPLEKLGADRNLVLRVTLLRDHVHRHSWEYLRAYISCDV